MSGYEPTDLAPLPLLFQTGYLTIDGVEYLGDERYYRLVYPNREIEQSFSRWLAQGLADVSAQDLSNALHRMVNALRDDDLDRMLTDLSVFFANIPYDITLANEKYYQTVFFVSWS